MKIALNTIGFTDAFVREVLRFVVPSGVANYTVRLTSTTTSYRGWASHSGTVMLRVGSTRHFPTRGGWSRPGKGYLPAPWLASRQEALVYLAAHELRHLWQTRVPRGHRVWGARGQYSERDADAYALKMLRAWRRRPTAQEPRETLRPVDAVALVSRRVVTDPHHTERRAAKTAPVDPRTVKLERTIAAIKRWETKRKRAETALKKLHRRQRAMERYAAKVAG